MFTPFAQVSIIVVVVAVVHYPIGSIEKKRKPDVCALNVIDHVMFNQKLKSNRDPGDPVSFRTTFSVSFFFFSLPFI